jgi:transcriptional regulator with XRE-family HTH domain
MSQFADIRARLLKVDMLKLVELRKRKGWSQEQLALQADLDPKTIHAMEAGQGKFKSTIAKVAAALGITKPEELLSSDQQPEVTAASSKCFTVIIRLPKSTLDDADCVTIIAQISQDANAPGLKIVTDVIRKSVSIAVEMSEEDAIQITNAFLRGVLERHNIDYIETTLHAFGFPVLLMVWRHNTFLGFGDILCLDTERDNFLEFSKALQWSQLLINSRRIAFVTLGAMHRLLSLQLWAHQNGRRVVWYNVDEVSEVLAMTKLDTIMDTRSDLGDPELAFLK